MKAMKFLSTLIILILVQTTVYATDIIVRELGGDYNSIQQAINAASDGDRIRIGQRSGNLPWTEDLTVEKSLTILPEVEGERIPIVGKVDVLDGASTSLGNGKNIILLGLDVTDRFAAGNAQLGNYRADVSAINCSFGSMYAFSSIYFEAVNCTVTGTIQFRAGKVIGCTAVNLNIFFASHVHANVSKVYITGSRFINGSGITISTPYELYFENNFIYVSGSDAVKITSISSNAPTYITNNTFKTRFSGQEPLRVSNSTSSAVPVFVVNNIFRSISSNNSSIAIAGSSSVSLQVSYNVWDGNFSQFYSGTTDGTNIRINYSDISLNTTTGLVTGSAIVNKGHPANVYKDIDLSRNDVGCYGGSKTQNNYFPTTTTGPRVFYLDIPKVILVGDQINVKAKAYGHKE